ncbi:MAG: phosphate regulon sensor histidine kinase PhoR [Arenicella sp.]
MKPDLIKIVFVILACAAFGWTLDRAAEFGLIAAFACNIWLLYRAKRLHNWFSHVKALPHAEQGVFYLLHRDIKAMRETHQKQKRELQHNLKRVREASAALPDAIVITDANGEITWSNLLAAELLNIKQPRDSGHRINNLLRHPNFTDAYANHDQVPVNIDIEAPTKRAVTINLKVIDLAENMQMIVARDISRHVDITRAQKDFVSNVSHELKTPLTVMRGYLEIIEDSNQVDNNIKKPISDMLLQTKRMQSTIDDLLYLAKLESQSQTGALLPNHEPININHILEMIMDSALLLAERNKQTITMEVNDQLSVLGNESELQIAFSNLVTNAIRYTPAGGDIHIKWHHRDKKAIFSVADSGIGIAPKHISRLTERFYRVDQGRSRAKGGTGLGLAIVKNVLERHGAELNITSSLGNGSCFECVFTRDI